MTNLIYMYEKAKKEESDTKAFFNIRSKTDKRQILTPPINRRVKKHELRIVFEELCFTTKLTFNEVNEYLTILEKRVSDIEEVIDHHFNLIKQTIYQNKADKIEKQNKKYDDEKNEKSGKKTTRASSGTSMRTNRSSRKNSASSKNNENKKNVESEL